MSSCHGCAQGFGFLNKEVGCPKCGFSYCKKCLRFKIADLVKPSKSLLVCGRCHKIATQKMDPEEPPIITKALQRLESMENPSKPPITVYKFPQREIRLAQLKKGMSIEDQQIAERLQNLRSSRSDSETSSDRRKSSDNSDIEARLARLKGEEPLATGGDGTKASSMLNFKPKRETDDDLIARFADEVKLDENYDKQVVNDIEERLRKLREGRDVGACGSSGEGAGKAASQKFQFEDEDLSEEEQVRRIMERYKAEVELESKMGVSGENTIPEETMPIADDPDVLNDSGSDADIDVDHLCRICDEERAVLKCKECDGDLFCKKCFRELHLELGECHKPTSFKP